MHDAPEKQTGLGPVDSVFRGIVAVCRIVAGIALVAMTLLLGYQVFGRYVLNDTPTWVDPLSLLLVMLIAFLGAGIGVYENTHLSVVILRKIVSRKIRSLLVVTTDALMALFGGLMLWYGGLLTIFKWNSLIPLIQWPEGLRSLPLTICGGLILIFSLGHLVRHLIGRDTRTDSIE
jgi:TRAP-type C4-dicarboxylate transport system permease small subunit